MDELTVSPPKSLASYVKDRCASNVVASLREMFPAHITAKRLMAKAGFPVRSDPVIAFASLCIAFKSANSDLARR